MLKTAVYRHDFYFYHPI